MMAAITFSPSESVARELDHLVRSGRYQDLPAAMTEAVRLLVRREQALRAVAQMTAIRDKLAGWQADVTRTVVDSHGEEA